MFYGMNYKIIYIMFVLLKTLFFLCGMIFKGRKFLVI